jgi:FKBP-type peptidyl-prolyl cis-trans isomerase
MSPKSSERIIVAPFEAHHRHSTLDELSNLDDAHDEEIDEDCAFDVDDERALGPLMSSPKIRSGNVTLSVIPSAALGGLPIFVDIARGSKMTLSATCLDVESCDFQYVKLMYRCVYPKEGGNRPNIGEFVCLCNYLGAKNGGIGLSPCTPIGLDIVGPCRVEFKGTIDKRAYIREELENNATINVFGMVMPIPHRDVDADVYEGASSLQHAVALSSKEKEDTEEDVIPEKGDPIENDGNSTEEGGVVATKKRKPEDGIDVAKVDQPPSSSGSTILSKKERKKLAQEKAGQLEETLVASRNNVIMSGDLTAAEDDDEPARKKSKKKKNNRGGPEGSLENDDGSNRTTPNSKPTSLTRERRLVGGLIVSDVLLGTGAPVKPGKRISLHYTGSLRSTGKVFDKNNSKQHPLVFRQGTGEVIRGEKGSVLIVFRPFSK